MRRGLLNKLLLLGMVAAMTAACVNEDGQETSIAVVSEALTDDIDVAIIQFSIRPVDCADPLIALGPAVIIDRELEDQEIPGNLDDLQNQPLDENSSHLFADVFEVVEPGCYNISAWPLKANGEPSEDCVGAKKDAVEAIEGQTTEVLLINQCHGDDQGALDVVAALNQEPELEDAWFEESKFVCGSPETFCALAYDPDADPLEFGLAVTNDAPCTIVAGDQTGNPETGAEQCFEISCSDWGRVDLQLTVWDLLWVDGELVRFEDWEEAEGYGTPEGSRTELSLFAYFDGNKYYMDADGDGFGDANGEATLVCDGDEPPEGYVPDNTDCDDADNTVYPGAEEVCDDKDNDCDGEVDEGLNCDDLTCEEPKTCGYYTGDCNADHQCYCFELFEGGGECINDFWCSTAEDCPNGTVDCPEGKVCTVNTCCGTPKCAFERCTGEMEGEQRGGLTAAGM